jgi:hypothetical protein
MTTRKMILRLAETDPDFPKSVPSAGSETVWSLSQARCYFDPAADSSQARQYLGTEAHPDVVDAAEMARRVVARGYAPTTSQQMVLRPGPGERPLRWLAAWSSAVTPPP